MNKDDFYLNILVGIIAGLIVLLGQFVGETIPNPELRIGITIAFPFFLFAIFVKILEKRMKTKAGRREQ